MPLMIVKYWKLGLAALLVLVIGVQTVRLSWANEEIAEMNLAKEKFDAALADKRAEGVAEGKRLQAEAQAEVDAKAKAIADRRVADARRRATEATARAERLTKLLADSKWACLNDELPEEVLNEYRQ